MAQIRMDKRIRANLIRLRTEACLDQNCLTKKSGVAHIAQIESGARPAGKNTIVKLADALGVDIVEFFRPESWRTGRRLEDKLFTDMHSACSPECRQYLKELLTFILSKDISKKI